MFLAANQDAISEGTGLGMLANTSVNYAFDPQGISKGFGTLSASSKLYRGAFREVYDNFVNTSSLDSLTDEDGKETQVVNDLINSGS